MHINLFFAIYEEKQCNGLEITSSKRQLKCAEVHRHVAEGLAACDPPAAIETDLLPALCCLAPLLAHPVLLISAPCATEQETVIVPCAF